MSTTVKIKVKDQDPVNALRTFLGQVLAVESMGALLVPLRLPGKPSVMPSLVTDAQHLAAEFVNHFKIERPPLAALALTTDTSILTSIGNDYHFDDIFSKQIEALGRKGDIAWGLSTSGNSKNVIQAIEAANEKKLFSIALTGRGGKLADSAQLVFAAPSDDTALIQEAHITLGHILCELVERTLFAEKY